MRKLLFIIAISMMSSIGFAKDSAQPSDQQAKVAVENKESAA